MAIEEVTAETAATYTEANAAIILAYLEGCNPCERYKPVLEAFADAHPGVSVGKVNLFGRSSWLKRGADKITAVPTTLFFRGGEVVHQETGIRPLETLEKIATRVFSF